MKKDKAELPSRAREKRKEWRGGWWRAAGVLAVGGALAAAGLRVAGWDKTAGAWPAAGGRVRVRWAPEGGDPTERMVREPTVFALGSAVGFTRGLGEERVARAMAGRPGEAKLPPLPPEAPPLPPDAATPRSPRPAETAAWLSAASAPVAPGPSGRTSGRGPGWGTEAPTGASMSFSEGWESRMFGGVDLGYAGWDGPGNGGWSAEAEALFDGDGVPVRVFVTERSGVAAVDAAVAREIWKWRLRDASAPRRGRVRWRDATGPAEPALPPAPPIPGSEALP